MTNCWDYLQFKEEGVKGLFRGNGLNCVRVAPGKAIELCTFETVRALTGRAEIAGGVAGALNTLATYPLEVLRTRCALDQRVAKGGIGRALKRITRKEGVSVSTFWLPCCPVYLSRAFCRLSPQNDPPCQPSEAPNRRVCMNSLHDRFFRFFFLIFFLTTVLG